METEFPRRKRELIEHMDEDLDCQAINMINK
jgi:hypothetical protein